MSDPPAGACVVFDMDGVIVDSEPLWVRARKDLVREAGGRWLPEAETAMMGISSDRWSAYMRDRLGLEDMTPAHIRDEVLARMVARHRSVPELMRYYWDTIEACVPPKSILEGLVAAGFVNVFRYVEHGMFSEYRASKPR